MAGQPGFYDVNRRLEAILAKGDPLETINGTVPWESFRATIVRTIGAARARFKIEMMNLGFNVRRLGALERMATASA